MKIDATTGASAPTTPATTGPGLQGSKDEFLKLFMAQLQHQDPFAPTSGADMVAQLAQLSSVEQAKQTNTALAELAASQASAASAGLAGLVGRDCNAGAATFELDGHGSVPPLELTSTSPMKGASVVITDADGKELRRIPVPTGPTSTTIAWDGKDAGGRPLAAGSYQLTVDPGQSTSTIASQWHGRVDAIELTEDGARLRMGSVLLTPAAIRSIGATSSTPIPPTSTPFAGARS